MKNTTQIDRAWDCIEKGEWLEYTKNKLAIEGHGMAIFRFLEEKNNKNCEFYFAEKLGYFWNVMIDNTEESCKEIMKSYDGNNELLICVQIPDIHAEKESSIGSLRIYDLHTLTMLKNSIS